MPPIQAVLFDYGMVLSGPPDPDANERLRAVFNVPHDAFHVAYWQHRDAYDRGALTGPNYWHTVAHDLHQTLTPAQLDELLPADTALWTAPNFPMIAWAAQLQAAGIKTGILSNLGDAMEAGILAKFPWLADFAHHTFSHRLGIAKPDPAIYNHAAEGLATPPSVILFVDDRPENIAAAVASGMQTIQYTTHEAFLSTLLERKYPNLPIPGAKHS